MSNKRKEDKSHFNTRCPICDRKDTVGFLGGGSSKKYFCNECCKEFVVRNGSKETFTITASGTLESVEKK